MSASFFFNSIVLVVYCNITVWKKCFWPNKLIIQLTFKTLLKAFKKKVRNTCFRYVNNVDDADDIAQEVFIQVFESMSHFREESQMSTWVYRIAVNKSLDFLRSKKRKKRFGQLTSLFRFTEEGEEIIEIPNYETPERELEDKERKEVLDWAISKLPENQKTAIILSKYEGSVIKK